MHKMNSRSSIKEDDKQITTSIAPFKSIWYATAPLGCQLCQIQR